MEVILLLFSFLILYIIYQIVVRVAKAITNSDIKNEVVTGEVKKEGSKLSLKLKDWFLWNVQVNNEKGTAGGNVKINFPVKSAFGTFVICLIIALLGLFTPVTGWIIPCIFISFAFYNLLKWLRSLSTLSNAAKETVRKTTDEIKSGISKSGIGTLTRASKNTVVAGVCRGLQLRYGVPVFLSRVLFLGGPFIVFTSVAYLILWYFVPKANI